MQWKHMETWDESELRAGQLWGSHVELAPNSEGSQRLNLLEERRLVLQEKLEQIAPLQWV